jgi:DNA-binding ferritin-like protein
MDGRSFVTLHDQCAETLQEYVAQAEKMCSMLRNLKDKPLSATELKRLMVQRSRENEAHRKYMEIRERLLEVAQRDYRRD